VPAPSPCSTPSTLAAGCTLLACIALAGCASPGPTTSVRGTLDPAAPHVEPVAPVTSVCGHSHQNRPIEYQQWGFGPTRVLVLATMHGDEPAGTPLVEHMLEHLAHEEFRLASRLTLTIVPVVNPDGLAAGTRGNAADIDLNRDYPAANSRRVMRLEDVQPETRAMIDLVERFRPQRIVSIHQPIACIDWDGPARELAVSMAACCELPMRRLGARPGSLGSWAGVEKGIPVVTLELPAGAERESAGSLWERYGDAMMAFIGYGL
jgi:protein MpaA